VNDPTRLTELMHAVLDGEASESETRELELRLAADPVARAEFSEWRGLFQALREMPKEYAPEGLVAAVSAALPGKTAPQAEPDQPFPPRRVFGYTSTRAPGSRLGDPRAAQSPTPRIRSVSMSQQSSRFFASRKGWLGAGIVAAAAVVVAQLGFDFPVAKDVMGTVAPAQRYRAAPNGSEDVKLGAPVETAGSTAGIDATRSVAEKTADLTVQKKAESTAELAVQKKADVAVQQKSELTVQQKSELSAQKTAELTVQKKADLTVQKQADLTVQKQADLTVQKQADLTVQKQADLAAQKQADLAAQKQADKTMQRMDSNARSADKTTTDRAAQP
jgi:anti-sigma factor RsiW